MCEYAENDNICEDSQAVYTHQNVQGVNAMVATASTIADQSWYPDSGASMHISKQAPTKSSHQYTGSGMVTVGNGQKLNISNILPLNPKFITMSL